MKSVRQTMPAPPRVKLPRRLMPFSAYLQGCLHRAHVLDAAGRDAVLARCDERSRKAFELGELQRDPGVLPDYVVHDLLDGVQRCHCAERGLWAGIPRPRRRHATDCVKWTAPAAAPEPAP